MSNRYSNVHMHPKMSGSKFKEASAPKGGDMFAKGAKKSLPNHNPPQPHMNLANGPHTHSGAVRAVNAIHGKMSGPSMSSDGKPSVPSASRGANVSTGSKKVDAGKAVKSPNY